MTTALILPAFIAYLLGSIPFGLLITQAMGAGDIRKIGSGSIGATNVLRTGRKGLAAATLLLDAVKGAAAVLIGGYVAGDVGMLVCGVAAVVGHMFPVWLKFQGGKGVATGFGVLIAASPLSALACGVVWLVMAKLVKISSVAGISAVVAAPFFVWAITGSGPLILTAAIIAVLIIIRHHANIRRLLAGTEPKIGQK
jgi:glycerol-3-phosphate acyltransferase PlsY